MFSLRCEWGLGRGNEFGAIMGDDTLLGETIMLLRPPAVERKGAEVKKMMMEDFLRAVVDCAAVETARRRPPS